MRFSRVLALLAALPLLGCNLQLAAPAQQSLAPGALDVDDLGLQILEGKSKVFGTIRVPAVGADVAGFKIQAEILGSVAAKGAKIEVLDTNLESLGIETMADANGHFILDLVAKDMTVILQVTFEIDGKRATMRKIARSEQDFECVKVDLASTMLADKILSGGDSALFNTGDSALKDAPLIELFKLKELEKLEEAIRGSLTVETAEDKQRIADILTSPVSGGAAGGTGAEKSLAVELFDELAEATPELAKEYHEEVFVRPDAELHFTIKATGVIRNNRKQSLALKGSYKLRFRQIKPGTKAIELWFANPVTKKIGQGDDSNQWTIPIDTFQYPDGEYTMITIVSPEAGNKRPLGSAEVAIDNSFANHCQ